MAITLLTVYGEAIFCRSALPKCPAPTDRRGVAIIGVFWRLCWGCCFGGRGETQRTVTCVPWGNSLPKSPSGRRWSKPNNPIKRLGVLRGLGGSKIFCCQMDATTEAKAHPHSQVQAWR